MSKNSLDSPSKVLRSKSLLLDELSVDNVNVLRIRTLCRETPGLIASAGLRIKIWSLLLLGETSCKSLELVEFGKGQICREQQVLEADVPRTRGDMEEFRTSEYRKVLFDILHSFCLKHDIQYKQGMNEVLAPFLYTNPPSNENGVTAALFEAFLFRYLERYFCHDDSSFLFKAFRLFHILLVYHDPQLALYLHGLHFPPELYAPQWFLTLYSRSLPMAHVLRLWDVMIAVDDPAFTFFIGLCLLRRLRDAILHSEAELIPEIIAKIGMQGEEDVDNTLEEALLAYKDTPRCFCRHLRLVCVTSTELSPHPSSFHERLNKHPDKGHLVPPIAPPSPSRTLKAKINHNVAMAVQSVRSSIMISAKELVDSLAPITGSSPTGKGKSPRVEDISAPTTPTPQQYVLIDIRSTDENDKSGAGSLPRAICLEPEFLERPDAFEVWLEHFDNTRGCHIVIVDMPAVNLPGVALWRRLLLGEGDGVLDHRYTYTGSSKLGKAMHSPQATVFERDMESPYVEEESKALASDAIRPAIKLAQALQLASFPFVSVLDGGFPALVAQLLEARGTVEPVILNHDADKWNRFLEITGRRESAQSQLHRYNKVSKPVAEIASQNKLTPLQSAQVALKVANRLGHTTMEAVLRERIEALQKLEK